MREKNKMIGESKDDDTSETEEDEHISVHYNELDHEIEEINTAMDILGHICTFIVEDYVKKSVLKNKILAEDERAKIPVHFKLINDIIDLHVEFGAKYPMVNLRKLREYLARERKILVQKHLINRVEI
jgi:hypothetical protein